MSNFCPCCGHNFTADQPIERDGWRLVPPRGNFLRSGSVRLMPTPRAMPADFLEQYARLRGVRKLAEHYGTSKKIARRWRDTIGEPPAFEERYSPPPSDFAAQAATKWKTALMRHYHVGCAKIDRWCSETGVRPAPMGKRLNSFAKPVPADFAEMAPRMTRTELARHYGVQWSGTIERWCEQAGVEPKRAERRYSGSIAPTLGAGKFNHAKANYSPHDEAADVLRRCFPVYRCDERGRYQDKGKLWRCGNIVLSADELLAKAERYRERAA